MCKYGQFFFGGCQHQVTVLLDFCENATVLPKHEGESSIITDASCEIKASEPQLGVSKSKSGGEYDRETKMSDADEQPPQQVQTQQVDREPERQLSPPEQSISLKQPSDEKQASDEEQQSPEEEKKSQEQRAREEQQKLQEQEDARHSQEQRQPGPKQAWCLPPSGRRQQPQQLLSSFFADSDFPSLPPPPISKTKVRTFPAPESASSAASSLSLASSTLTSIPETAAGTSFLPGQHQQPAYHPPDTSPHDMASLASSGTGSVICFPPAAHTSKPIVTSSHASTTGSRDGSNGTTRVADEPSRPPRIRQPGLRHRTDKSCDLPDSDIIRHIAASTRDIHAHDIGTDHETQAASGNNDFPQVLLHDSSIMSDTLMNLSRSHLETRKNGLPTAEVQEIEADAITPNATLEKTHAVVSRPPEHTSPPQPEDSPAAVLQRKHELAERQAAAALKREPAPPPIPPPRTIVDFPELADVSSEKGRERNAATPQPRRLSYADMVSKHVPKAETLSRHSLPTNGNGDTERSAARPPDQVNNTLKRSPTSATNISPRFAQPTQAFTRRADETLRKELPSVAFKIASGASIVKSTLSVTQRHQKRKSLPGGWIPCSTAATAGKSTASELTSVEDFSPRPAVSSTLPSEKKTTTDVDIVIPKEQPGRKKGSTYMSPTKATAQREIATLKQVIAKQTFPSSSKPQTRVSTALPLVISLMSPPDMTNLCTISSASSISEQIILERNRDCSINTANRVAPGHIAPSTPKIGTVTRRSTVSTPTVADILRTTAEITGLPPNSTTQRRESHGHLLRPIMAKLGKYGVLSDAKSCHSQPNPYAKTMETLRRQLLETPERQHGARLEFNDSESESYCRPRPGHRRAHTIAGDYSRQTFSLEPATVIAIKGADNRVSGSIRSSQLPDQIKPQKRPLHLLRATAQEFMPASKPPSILQHELMVLDSLGMLGYHTVAQWEAMPSSLKRMIALCRNVKWGTERSSILPEATTAGTNYEAVNHRYRVSQQGSPLPTHHVSGFGTETSSTQSIRIGQVLQPEVDPKSGNVKWMTKDTQGNKIPVSFGRAAAVLPNTPPNSTDCSPYRSTMNKHFGWSIASASSDSRYRWASGDGREIKFRGHGPDAEREPSNVVNFSLWSKAAPTAGAGPRMINIDDDRENSAPLAPRSRSQWARKLGLDKVPCNTVHIERACELICPAQAPYLHELDAFYCLDCRPNQPSQQLALATN